MIWETSNNKKQKGIFPKIFYGDKEKIESGKDKKLPRWDKD